MELNELVDRVKSLRCPQCGSTDIEITSLQAGKCKHCGTIVLIEEPKKEIINNININVKQTDGNVIPFYEIKKEFDIKEFETQIFTRITYDETTPTDILDADFSAPYEQNKFFVKHTGEVTLTYNCSVGYDRQEEYSEWSNASKSYVTRTRKVTDWKPLSGTYTGKYDTILPLDKNNNLNDKIAAAQSLAVLDCIKTAKNSVPVDGVDFDVSDDKKDDAEYKIERDAASDCKYSIKADHVKDFNYSAIVNITETEFYKIPQYTVDYKYNDKNYKLHAFSAGKFHEYGATPNVSKDINSEAEVKNVKFNILSIMFLIASIVVSVLVQSALYVFLAFAAAITMYIITKLTFKKAQNSIIETRQAEKERKLDAFLKRKGLDKLKLF